MTAVVGPADEPYRCGNCDRTVDPAEAIRSEPLADLDPAKWQTLNCPHCGARLETVFVGLEGE